MYFSLYTEETEHELIMTPWETNALETEILIYFNILYYDTIYSDCISLPFSIYIATKYNLYWCSLIFVKMVI